jgi:hypothetical protein
MNKIRVLSTVALTVSTLVASWANAQTTDRGKHPTLTDQDHREILQLYARFNHGSDFRDAEMWLSVFDEDASFKPPTGAAIVGRKALTDWRSQTLAGKSGDSKRRHWSGSVLLTPTPDGGAKARTYLLVFDVSGPRPVLASSAYADDVFVKTPGGWKLKSRVIVPDSAAE